MIRLIVFDLDGTVLDTLADLTAALNYALQKNGLPPEIRAAAGRRAWFFRHACSIFTSESISYTIFHNKSNFYRKLLEKYHIRYIL